MIAGRASAVMLRGTLSQFILLMLSVSGAISVYALVMTGDDTALVQAVNGSMPAALGAVCLLVSYRMVRSNATALWTPLPWFLFAWAAYYGFGPLVYIYGTPETIAYMNALYVVNGRDLLLTNLLNAVGLAAVALGATLFSGISFRFSNMTSRSLDHDPWRVALLFLIIGLPIKLFFEIPYKLHLMNFVLPGMIQGLGPLSGFAIVPLSLAASRGRRTAKVLYFLLIIAEITFGFLTLSKLEIIRTGLFVFLGQYLIRRNFNKLFLSGVAVVILYAAVLSPFVDFARVILNRATTQDAAELVTVTGAYTVEGREVLAGVLPGVQGWWSRLAYPNAQAFAMNEYDHARPGTTFGLALYALVPRFIYGDKPIMTPGVDFTYSINGSDASSTGLGVFGDAYWNGGWLLVIFVGIFVGGLFVVLGRFSIFAVVKRRWLYMPLVLGSVFLGLRPDDWFVAAYIGGVLQLLLMIFLMRFLFSSFVRSRFTSGKYERGERSLSRNL